MKLTQKLKDRVFCCALLANKVKKEDRKSLSFLPPANGLTKSGQERVIEFSQSQRRFASPPPSLYSFISQSNHDQVEGRNDV